MKKSTLSTVYAILTNSVVADEARADALADVSAELKLADERKQAKMRVYEQAYSVVIDALHDYGPITAKELFAQIEKDVPEGFTINHLQYGLNRLWMNVVTIDSTASPHTYSI